MRSDVCIGIVDEYAGLNVACGVDVEVVSSACDTTAYILGVVLEVHYEYRLARL